MMGELAPAQNELFYDFCLEKFVPEDHLLRHIDSLLDLSRLRHHLKPFYSRTGRPSVDPELMVRMLIIGYCFGVRSERRLCEEVHLNLAYRWFCRLGLEGGVPDHSTISKNRYGRFLIACSTDFFNRIGILQPSQRPGEDGWSTSHTGHQPEYGPLLHRSSLEWGAEQSFRSGLAKAETG
jgi:hypothetical protein